MSTIDAVSENISALFPGPEDRVKWDDYLTLALSDARCRIPEQPVSPYLDMKRFRQELAQFDLQSPLPLSDLLPWVIAKLKWASFTLLIHGILGCSTQCQHFRLNVRTASPPRSILSLRRPRHPPFQSRSRRMSSARLPVVRAFPQVRWVILPRAARKRILPLSSVR